MLQIEASGLTAPKQVVQFPHPDHLESEPLVHTFAVVALSTLRLMTMSGTSCAISQCRHRGRATWRPGGASSGCRPHEAVSRIDMRPPDTRSTMVDLHRQRSCASSPARPNPER